MCHVWVIQRPGLEFCFVVGQVCIKTGVRQNQTLQVVISVIDECTLWRVKTSVCSVCTQDSTGSVVLPYRQVLSSPYPSTHIDVDINTLKQMPPCHEHTYHQRRYMRAELSALWKTNSEEEISPDNLINIQESFTPDLYVLSHSAYVTIRHFFLRVSSVCHVA